MLKVLQIVAAPTALNGASVSVNGPERRAANLITRWRDEGVEPIVCYPRRAQLWQRFETAGVALIDFEIGSKFNLRAPGRIANIAKAYSVDLIHTQGPASLDLFASIGGRIARIPVVVTRPVMIEHHTHYASWKRLVYGAIDRAAVLRGARRIIAVSDAGRRHLRDHCGVEADRLQLIYNGTDLAKFSPRTGNALVGKSNEPPVVIGMVAQLTAPKSWPDFIEVIARLNAEGLNVLGLIVGEGDLRSALEKHVAQRNLAGRIEFTGFLHDVTHTYHRMDIFLFTSRREGLSVAIIEALASSLPVVITGVGGLREQAEEGVNGYVVDVGDIETMTRHCRNLIRNPGLRVAMGQASRKLAESRFSESTMFREHVRCYREAVRSVSVS